MPWEIIATLKKQLMGPEAEVLGLPGLEVTDHACRLVERAGFRVRLVTIEVVDLGSFWTSTGLDRLPAVRTEDKTYEGMKEIRQRFESR